MPAAGSPLARAFDALLAAKKRSIGREEFVLIDGRKFPAVVTALTPADTFIAGGVAQDGGFSCSVAQSLLPVAPEKFTAIECRGVQLVVMDANDINGVTWDITAGDPSADEA